MGSPPSPEPLAALLARIEAYYDAVPRATARGEDWYPFTLFVHDGPGWPFYARPALGATTFSAQDVLRVQQRQRELHAPEAFEWVAETTPALAAAVEAAGLPRQDHPLMVLDLAQRRRPAVPPGATVRLLGADDPPRLLALADAAAHVGFGAPGVEVGAGGPLEVTQAAARRSIEFLEFLRQRLRGGHTATVIASLGEAGGVPLSVGSHQPVGDTTEIVGVATVPAYRRRGLAAAVVDRLADDALARGVRTIFLSTGSARTARVYEGLGFRTVATACVAEPPDPQG